MSDIKPRNERVGFTTRDKVDSIMISRDPTTGKIEVDTPVINGYSEVAYDRPKGDKILLRFPVPTEELDFDLEKAAERNFDIFFAVDTNTWDIAGRRVSVTGVCECHNAFIGDRSGIVEPFWQLDMPICFAFTGARDDPERAGWALTSDFIHTSEKYDRYPRVALIVDCHLGQLQEYNARTRPLVADAHLGKRLTLVYASYDAGGEYFLNQMLRQADRVSRVCLEHIKSGAISLRQKPVSDYFESLLHINPTRPPAKK